VGIPLLLPLSPLAYLDRPNGLVLLLGFLVFGA
jgi:hypothetical protein